MTVPDSEGIFPADDVAACAADAKLQEEHREKMSEAECENLEYVRGHHAYVDVPDSAVWIFFESPGWTWESECGREGWLLYDPESKTQHAFVMTAMS